MFEALKNRMNLEENKKFNEDALAIMCEEYEFDEAVESLVLEDAVTDDAEDAEIDALIDELDDDEILDDELIESVIFKESADEADLNDAEKAAKSDAPVNYFSTDLDIL